MDKNIGIGAIVGLVTASSLYVWNSESFTKNQKILLLFCAIFFPLQWILILIFLSYNKNVINNSVEKISERKVEQFKLKVDNTISNLYDLKSKGILTEEEYNQKVEKLEAEKTEQDLKNSTEYKQLKSLLDTGILTKEEFEIKVKKIKTLTKEAFYNDYRIVDGFSEGLGLAINSDLDYGFVNEEGIIVIPFKFEHAENFKEGYSYVRYKGVFRNIDKKGNFV